MARALVQESKPLFWTELEVSESEIEAKLRPLARARAERPRPPLRISAGH